MKTVALKDYEKQAKTFATKYDVKMEILKRRDGIMWDDNVTRDIYTIQLSRNDEVYTFDFGASIISREQRIGCHNHYDAQKKEWLPTLYTVLSCLSKEEVGDFIDFCETFGYEATHKSMKVYKAVKAEYENIVRLFPESGAMNALRKIQ